MKRYNLIPLFCLLFFTIGIFSCEKDDLCDPSLSVTPRLIITFVDVLNPQERKTIDRLGLKEIGSPDFAPLDLLGSLALTNVDSIAVPLRTDHNSTSYNFYKEDATGINIDNIDFNYTIEEQYINRACGFKVIYNNLEAVQNLEPVAEQWIRDVRVITESVTSNNDIHIEIRH